MLKNVLTPAILLQTLDCGLVCVEHPINHVVDRKRRRHAFSQVPRDFGGHVGMVQGVRNRFRQFANILRRDETPCQGPVDFGNSTNLRGDQGQARSGCLQDDVGENSARDGITITRPRDCACRAGIAGLNWTTSTRPRRST